MSPKSVFISYRRDQLGNWMAGRVCESLTQNGYDTYLDVQNLGAGNWSQQLLSEISGRTHFLLILTPSCLERCVATDDPVRIEVEHARQNNKNIVPMIDDSVALADVKQTCPNDMKWLFEIQHAKIASHNFTQGISLLIANYLVTPTSSVSSNARNVKRRTAVQTKTTFFHTIGKLDQVSALVVNRLLDMLILLALMVTLYFGMHDEWRGGLLIPLSVILKGFWIVRDLPTEATLLCYISIITLVFGTTTIVGSQAANRPQSDSWRVAGLLSFGFGAGVATAVANTFGRKGRFQ